MDSSKRIEGKLLAIFSDSRLEIGDWQYLGFVISQYGMYSPDEPGTALLRANALIFAKSVVQGIENTSSK